MERPHNYASIIILDISCENLEELPCWVSECKNLKYLNCSWNKITKLDNLPTGLKDLNCSWNHITQLDNLPQTLEILEYFNTD